LIWHDTFCQSVVEMWKHETTCQLYIAFKYVSPCQCAFVISNSIARGFLLNPFASLLKLFQLNVWYQNHVLKIKTPWSLQAIYKLVKLHELIQQLVISHKSEWATQKITLECGHVAQITTKHSPLYDMNLAYAWLLDWLA
jgi:hypothetical protein